MNIKMVFPLENGKLVMQLKQTDQGRVMEAKTITATTPKELAQLQKMGWKVQQ